MATPPLSRELAQQAVDAMSHARALGKGNRHASSMIGVASGTLATRLESARRLYGMTPTDAPAPVVEEIPPARVRVRVRVKARRFADDAPITTVVAIGDSHQQPGMSVDRFRWISRYVIATQPDKVVHMGDLGEFSSVSRHEAPGSLQQKIRPSFMNDLGSVEEALAAYRKELGDCPIEHRIVLGNHEERVRTFETGTAELEGALWPMLMDVLARYDFRATEYREYLAIEGCMFTHVPMTLREQPYNGKTLNPLSNDLTWSLCFAHTHRFAFLNVPKIGRDNRITILNAGSSMPHGFYPVHNKSEQGATTWGVVSLKIQLGQIIQHEFVPLTELEDRYG